MIRGGRIYFGPLDDPDGALAKYEREDLYAGRTPRNTDDLDLRALVNQFFTARTRKLEVGELKSSTFGEYYRIGKRLIDAFGPTRLVDDLTADDFGRFWDKLAKTLGPLDPTEGPTVAWISLDPANPHRVIT